MRIIYKESFAIRLENQIGFIAKDSPQQARKFKNELISAIQKIPLNPYQYRKSVYFESNQIRDLVFKGAVIVFRIYDDKIEVFGYIKFQNSVF